jgi:RND family efflux transporter MFP subunit
MTAQQPGLEPVKAPRAGVRPILVFFVVLGAVVGAAVVAGLLPRLNRQKGLLAAAQEFAERKPVVIVSPAHLAASKDTVDLPADLVAMIETPIFSRVDGYLKTKAVDLGWHVTAGQLMAEIETPELDQQIGQARATVEQTRATLKELQADIELARANLELSRITDQRWQALQQQGVVSKQDADTRRADLSVKEATLQKADAALATARNTINANQAALRRLEETKGFARVTAPFEGVVTERLTDVGTLINAGSKEMFKVARLDPMRVFVNVPQTHVAAIREGQEAELRVQELPGRVFSAKVSGISHSLDTGSRSELVILLTPNPDGKLLPGMYAQVRLSTTQGTGVLRIPGDALILGKSGASVAVVAAGNVVHLRKITIGQDLGQEVEVTAGLSSGEMVVSNPTDAVTEGAVVETRNGPQAARPARAGSTQP